MDGGQPWNENDPTSLTGICPIPTTGDDGGIADDDGKDYTCFETCATCSGPEMEDCLTCAMDGGQPWNENDPTSLTGICPIEGGGYCFAGDSTVAVLDTASRTVATRRLTELKVGDTIQAMVTSSSSSSASDTTGHRHTEKHKNEKAWAVVAGVGSSKSSGFFHEITMMSTPQDGPTTLKALRATEHHTFPTCHSSKTHSNKKAQTKSAGSMVPAHMLKAGDCLLTAEGERMVASVKRSLAGPQDTTYTVNMEGATALIVVNGIVTHAKPSSSAGMPHHPASAAATAKHPHLKATSASMERNKKHTKSVAKGLLRGIKETKAAPEEASK
jgi:hypothetical protein